MVRGASGGVGMLESSSVEIEEKIKPKRVALSVRETAMVSSEWISEVKIERPKLLETLLAKVQKDLLMYKKMRGWQIHFG